MSLVFMESGCLLDLMILLIIERYRLGASLY